MCRKGVYFLTIVAVLLVLITWSQIEENKSYSIIKQLDTPCFTSSISELPKVINSTWAEAFYNNLNCVKGERFRMIYRGGKIVIFDFQKNQIIGIWNQHLIPLQTSEIFSFLEKVEK